MADPLTAEKRSALMSRIRGKDTAPELTVRSALWSAGLRYRLHNRKLPGRPDIVLKRWNAVVLIHGCFWHHHAGCTLGTTPTANQDFWLPKLQRNRERDIENVAALHSKGLRVAVVWECALKSNRVSTLASLIDWIRGKEAAIELGRFRATL